MADSTLTDINGVGTQSSTVTSGIQHTSDHIESLVTREPDSFSGGLVTPTAAPPINSSYATSLQRVTPQLTTFFTPPPDCTEGLFTLTSTLSARLSVRKSTPAPAFHRLSRPRSREACTRLELVLMDIIMAIREWCLLLLV